MFEIASVLFAVVAAVLYVQMRKERLAARQTLAAQVQSQEQHAAQLAAALHAAQIEAESLAPYRGIRDLDAEMQKLRRDAESELAAAHEQAAQIISTAQAEAAHAAEQARLAVAEASDRATEIKREAAVAAKARSDAAEQRAAEASAMAAKLIEDAKTRAEEIAGDAYRALERSEFLAATVKALENTIRGYGDKYLIPTYSILDELGEAYSHTEAGQQLRKARDYTKLLVQQGRAANCEYVEAIRRETAIRFAIDAFNGRVDSILSRSNSDNLGTLAQQIRDAYALVAHHGAAFRNARVTDEYLNARLEELRWAVAAQALREQEREEQRRIREQIREEEKARREIERALKEAAKEEEVIRRAMEKAQAQAAHANAEQRVRFEQQLRDLEERLHEAEVKNQRALSMAQQTKAGHVYVISNVGSFGENVYKVGMTRRLEPLDRIRELGDASVPFGFDVHALIWSDDAPRLETWLHRRFVQMQINKVNPRKEFFRVGLAELRKEIEAQGLQTSWTMAADAAEYRESLATEQRIAADAVAREQWMRQQLDYEADAVALEDVSGEAPA